MTALPVVVDDCWNRIGIRGDQSCPELAKVVHCHNCPVFTDAGRRFLNSPSPPGYLEEWTERLAASPQESETDLESVLIFRLHDEWLALTVHTLVEVTPPRTVHRVPHRGGLLDGIVNIRGELALCVNIGRMLGIRNGDLDSRQRTEDREPSPTERLLVTRRDADRWVFPVDEVDLVHRFPRSQLAAVPATVRRASGHLTRGVFDCNNRTIGLLDEVRLFEALRTRLR
ncbi:MAG: chemotaxis protein CheW [Gemmataceae bacterium]|nr:chemotaxis protein CheW [Gemmataceae bacterium]